MTIYWYSKTSSAGRDMKNKKSTIFAILVVLGFLIGTLGNVSAEERDETKIIKKDTGTTEMFGGGDFVFIRFNNDAAFGVIYGTEENPNSIITVALHTRYLGGADIYDENGASIGKKRPIKVITVLAQKLDDLFEFNDTNDDGLCNYKRVGQGIKYTHFPWHEPIYKKISLETSWERSRVLETTNENEEVRKWDFSLKAENLNYIAIGDSENINEDVREETLEKIEFTFHLKAKLVEIDNAIVPYYNVKVKKGDESYDIIDSERIKNKTVSGKRGKYNIKYDHEINGWDFDPSNKNPFLLLEHHAIVGNLIPEKLGKWMKHQLVEKLNGEGTVKIEEEDGNKEFRENEAMDEKKYNERKNGNLKPRKLKGKFIEIGGNWEKIGRFTWVSNVTVDGEDKEMYCQFQGHIKVNTKNADGNIFTGQAILAGFSYPGGNRIFHDPEMSSEILIESQDFETITPSPGNDRNFRPILAILVVGLVGAAGLAYTVQKQNKDKFYHDQYDRVQPKKEEKSWEDFYKRK